VARRPPNPPRLLAGRPAGTEAGTEQPRAEAEPLLLAGYEGMKQRENKIPTIGKPRLKETLQRRVQLYEATPPEEAAA